MHKVEKKREDEIDSKMNVAIDLVKGTVDQKKETDQMFAFHQQVEDTNLYLTKSITGSVKYKPFEGEGGTSIVDPLKALQSMSQFSFKAADLSKDEKSQNLYDRLSETHEKNKKAANTNKQGTKLVITSKEDEKKALVKPVSDFENSGLGRRLQTENPFEAFRSTVEDAIIEKAEAAERKVFQGDRDFFTPFEDQGMCISMH